jgi:hypothetical protein
MSPRTRLSEIRAVTRSIRARWELLSNVVDEMA